MRQIDLKYQTLSRTTLTRLFSRLYAELSLVASYPVGSGAFPRFGAGHLGSEINTAIDGVDTAINTGALMLGKSAPANGTRAYDFTTGSHDVTRLHSELDRLHGRIDALGKGSMNGSILPPFPYTLHRTGSATYTNTAGTFTTAGDGVPRITSNGLLLEGAGTNLLVSPNDFTNAAWVKQAAGTGTIPTVVNISTLPPNGTSNVNVSKITFSQGAGNTSGDYSVIKQNIAAANPHAESNKVWLKTADGSTKKLAILNATHVGRTLITVTGVWQPFDACTSSCADTATSLNFGCVGGTGSDTSGDILAYYAQTELNPFPTSFVEGTRNPDQCAVVEPHNLFKWSNRLDKTEAWSKDANCSLSNDGSTNTVNFTGASNNGYWQDFAGCTVAKSYTYAIKVKKGTFAGTSISLYVSRLDTLAFVGSKTIAVADIDASTGAYRTFYVTVTTPHTGLRCIVYATGGTGTVLVESCRLIEGSHPGVEVMTQDIPILPSGITTDPLFWQNGAIELDVVPVGATGILGYYVSAGDAWLIWCDATKVYFDYSNGTAVTRVSVTKTLVAGTKYHIKPEWFNYVQNSTRQRFTRLTVDTTSATSTVATSGNWYTPERLWLCRNTGSTGIVNAVISNVIPSYNPIPAGATL